jgi:hypothetical protein
LNLAPALVFIGENPLEISYARSQILHLPRPLCTCSSLSGTCFEIPCVFQSPWFFIHGRPHLVKLFIVIFLYLLQQAGHHLPQGLLLLELFAKLAGSALKNTPSVLSEAAHVVMPLDRIVKSLGLPQLFPLLSGWSVIPRFGRSLPACSGSSLSPAVPPGISGLPHLKTAAQQHYQKKTDGKAEPIISKSNGGGISEKVQLNSA